MARPTRGRVMPEAVPGTRRAARLHEASLRPPSRLLVLRVRPAARHGTAGPRPVGSRSGRGALLLRVLPPVLGVLLVTATLALVLPPGTLPPTVTSGSSGDPAPVATRQSRPRGGVDTIEAGRARTWPDPVLDGIVPISPTPVP